MNLIELKAEATRVLTEKYPSVKPPQVWHWVNHCLEDWVGMKDEKGNFKYNPHSFSNFETEEQAWENYIEHLKEEESQPKQSKVSKEDLFIEIRQLRDRIEKLEEKKGEK